MTSSSTGKASNAEESLRQNLARLAALIENVQMGVLFEDDARHVLHANADCCTLFGIPSPELIVGADSSQITQQAQCLFADPEAFVEQIEARLAAGQPAFGDVLVLLDGRIFERDYVPVRVGEAGGGHMWLFRDATERKRAEQELERSSVVLRAIIESSASGVLVMDGDGNIIISNQRLARMWGLPADWEHTLSAGERRQFFAQQTTDPECFLRCTELSAQNPEMQIRETLTTDDGRIVDMAISPFRMGGAVAGRLFSFRDATELARKQEVSLQAQKLEAVGLLAGGIAHDFNNALTVILGNVTLARQSLPAGDETQERLGAAETACLRARALTQQLLTFSRGGAPIKRRLTLNALLTDIASLALRGSNVVCDRKVAADLWPVDADEGQIRQVMLNLLVNAKEAMPAGGSIELSAENVVAAGEAPGRRVQITLRDHGEGISAENLPRIFDPYFTTKPKGRGMGLAAAYSIVRDHGGQISAESEPGVGTVITVRLLASGRSGAAPPKAPAPVTTPALRILIMDDEDLVRDVAGRMLERVGHRVAFARDGAEALAAYAQAQGEGQPFDVVIMDLTIPGGMGGKEAVSRLLQIDPQARVIVSSGYSNDPIMADHERHGFCGVVAKPYQSEELHRAIAACFGACKTCEV